ncbi:MAG TPA: hypothetical protein VG455_10945 [Acidimicrobiales bacterium]|nr:hypothetical protein [Acidimicrobiales bacterium]
MGFRRKLETVILVGALTLAGCGDDNGETTVDTVEQQTEEAARDARAAAQDIWASVRTDAERLLDQIRTEDAPRFKEQLLERCRDALERLRKAESDAAGRVEDLCSRIQETDVTNADAWADIRREIDQVDVGR